MIAKELREAEHDLTVALESLKERNGKWATIQGYYSMFHSARALLYSKGYDERGHRAMLTALRELYSGKLSSELLDDFEDAMGLREAADYGSVYTEEGANSVTEAAQGFLEASAKLLRGRELSR